MLASACTDLGLNPVFNVLASTEDDIDINSHKSGLHQCTNECKCSNSDDDNPSIPKTINVTFVKFHPGAPRFQSKDQGVVTLSKRDRDRRLFPTTTKPKNACWEAEVKQKDPTTTSNLQKYGTLFVKRGSVSTAASIGKDILKHSFGTKSYDDISEVTLD
jgi:hypothetical protein